MDIFQLDYIIIAVVEVFSHFVNGCTGFGATVIASPIVTGMLGMDIGVPFGTLVSLPCIYLLGIQVRKNVDWKALGKIIILMAPGVLMGNFLINYIPANYAKVGLGTFITLLSLWNILKLFVLDPQKAKKGEVVESVDTPLKKGLRVIALIIGGIIHGAYNIGGPLITVFTLYEVEDKTRFRNTMTWVWIIVNTVFNVSSQYASGKYADPVLWQALVLSIPLALVGWYAGVAFLEKINRTAFLKVVFLTLLLTGGSMLQAALVALGWL